MERWFQAHEQEYAYLVDPSTWKSNYQLALGDKGQAIIRFCQRWEADSTPADIICMDGRLQRVLRELEPADIFVMIWTLVFLVISVFLSCSFKFSFANRFLQAAQGLITLSGYFPLLS
jgi:hypothetical protein